MEFTLVVGLLFAIDPAVILFRLSASHTCRNYHFFRSAVVILVPHIQPH